MAACGGEGYRPEKLGYFICEREDEETRRIISCLGDSYHILPWVINLVTTAADLDTSPEIVMLRGKKVAAVHRVVTSVARLATLPGTVIRVVVVVAMIAAAEASVTRATNLDTWLVIAPLEVVAVAVAAAGAVVTTAANQVTYHATAISRARVEGEDADVGI